MTFWIAALTPRSVATAERLPRWHELNDAGRIHPTALAAVRAYREHGTG